MTETICLISGQFPPHTSGGAENYVLRTAKELQSRGFDIAILTTKPYDGISSLNPTKDIYEGLDVWRFYPVNWSHLSEGTGQSIMSKIVWHAGDIANPHSAVSVKRTLAKVNPSIIHTNNLTGISPATVPAIRSHDARHVHTLHDYSLICPRGSLLRDFTASGDDREICKNPPVPCKAHAQTKRYLVGDPDIVHGPSQHVIDVHRDYEFFSQSRSLRIPLGLDSEAIRSETHRSNDPNVLYVGNIQESKGIDIILKAARQRSHVEFHLCGDGPMTNHVETATEKIPNLIYHGFVSEEKLVSLRREAWIAIVPSIWMENSPYVIYESYANGLPVLGSNIGGIPELITEGETGWLFEPDSATELLAKLDRALSPKTIGEVSKNAIEKARELTINNHVDELVSEAYGLD